MNTDISNSIEDAFSKHNVILLTGAGGTGKTTAIKGLAATYPKSKALTALTGIASTHINGTTIHRFSGIGIQNSIKFLPTLLRDTFRWPKIRANINNTNLVVIDEISMMRSDVFDLINAVFQKATGSNEPFGGKKVLLSGDFLQLPPVVKKYEDLPCPWAFQSRSWLNMSPHIYLLSKVHRQQDAEFVKALQEIRLGCCPPWIDAMMKKRKNLIPDSEISPIKFLSTNNQVDVVNDLKLSKITSAPRSFEAKIWGHTDILKRQIQDDCIAPINLVLKQGAQVMILRNDDAERFVNGSMGVLTDFDDDGFPVVKLSSTGELISFPPHAWERHDIYGNTLASFTQIPLKLAYAITIHKSQGMTLDCAEIECGRIFADGQLYVALSRVKSLDGLYLSGWSPQYVQANPDALKFYASLSEETNFASSF